MSDVHAGLAAALADRYRLERELGAGGMATVYLALDQKHHRQVALKVLRPELAHAIGPERFLREIETTAALHHPHILPLYDSGQALVGSEIFLYYVMPYVEGESLRARLDREKQLPLDDALQIAREVADALSYAHSRGVIHRDIKPENILLESGHAMVADFGIAKAVSAAGGETLTQTGVAIGTPRYMSPEQAAGEKDLDGRSDLYSLACVLYEMLGGQPPFTGPTVESVVRQHLAAEPPSITQLRPAVPTEVAGVLQRALAKTPADRFNPVAQFSEALRRPTGSAPATASGRPGWVPVVGAAVVLGLAALATALVLRSSRRVALPVVGRTVQVTREPGLEIDPAISPDGQLVAYAAGPLTNMQIFVRQVAGGRTVQLTSDSGGDKRWPRWSPDGTRIAYQAIDGIYVIPALGGSPRLVARTPQGTFTFGGSYTPLGGLTWSPDGRRIAFAANYGAARIYLVDAAGGEPTVLPAPREVHSPAWSPDGRRIAVVSGNPIFIFGSVYFGNAGASSIWVVPVDGGPPAQVTDAVALNGAPQWTPDGRALLFVSDRGGSEDVYQVPMNGNGKPTGTPQRVTTGLDAQTITLSPDGRYLAYARLRSTSNIWSLPVPALGGGPVSARGAVPVTTGDQIIESLDVTRDGKWLVFDSNQLTSDSLGKYGPTWSPDGRRIAFHIIRKGNRDIYTMNADGTGLAQRTNRIEQEFDPSWSPDGDSLAVEVTDTGSAGVTHMEIVGLGPTTALRRVSLDVPGDFVRWSPAGRPIAYHAADGIRAIDPGGGPSRLLTDNANDGTEAYYAEWAPDGRTLYYLARGASGWMIRAIPARGGPSRVLVRFEDPAHQPTRYGFRTDGRRFYLTMGSQESDVWVADLGDSGRRTP
jgi:Tol biopolymer transport system component